jgi:mono/diheme cytochrome c family protein
LFGAGVFYDGARAGVLAGGCRMKLVAFILVIQLLGWSQDLQDVLKQGLEVFDKTFATGSCHGQRGTVGSAPRLAARGFDQDFLTNTIMRRVPGTSMAGFGTALSRPQITAVAAYLTTLNGIANPRITGAATTGPAEAPATEALSSEGAHGRALFSEAYRSFRRCSTCHDVQGIGISVTTPIKKVPANVAAPKALDTPAVKTATVGGEQMPVLVLSQGKQRTLFYDLTLAPPVLRNVSPSEIQIGEGTRWRHSSVVTSYTDAELASVLPYLRTVVR